MVVPPGPNPSVIKMTFGISFWQPRSFHQCSMLSFSAFLFDFLLARMWMATHTYIQSTCMYICTSKFTYRNTPPFLGALIGCMIKAKPRDDGVKSSQNLAFGFRLPSNRFHSSLMAFLWKDPGEEPTERAGCSLSKNHCAVSTHYGVVVLGRL